MSAAADRKRLLPSYLGTALLACALALIAGTVVPAPAHGAYRDAVLADAPINYWRLGETASIDEDFETYSAGSAPAWASVVGTWNVQSWSGTKAVRTDTAGNVPSLAVMPTLVPRQRTVNARLVDVVVDGTNQPHPGIVVAYSSLSNYDAVYCQCSSTYKRLMRWQVRSGAGSGTPLTAALPELEQGVWLDVGVRLDDTGMATVFLDGLEVHRSDGWLTGTTRVGMWSSGAGEGYVDDLRVTPLPLDETGSFTEGFSAVAIGSNPGWLSSTGTFNVEAYGGDRMIRVGSTGAYGIHAVFNRTVPRVRTVAATLVDTDALNAPHPGVVVAWQDANNYDAIYLRYTNGELMHWKYRGGVISVITLATPTITQGAEHRVSARLDNSGTVAVSFDGTLVSTTSGWLTNTTRVGVYSSDPGVGYVDDIRVSQDARLGYFGAHDVGATGMAFGDGDTAVGYDGATGLTALDVPAVNTTASGFNSVEFWMWWDGTSNDMPFGFEDYDLYLVGSKAALAFNTGVSDVFGTPWTGLGGRWVHVVGIFHNGDPELSRLFVDGTERSLSRMNTVPTPRSATSMAQVSGWSSNRSYRFSGRIDEVAIYDRALSSARIVAHYDAALHPPSAPSVLQQQRADGSTAIATGSWTVDGAASNLVLRFSASDPNTAQTLTPWVEVRPTGVPFSATCGAAVAGVTFSGTAVAAPTANSTVALRVDVSGLASGGYAWRACVVDQSGQAGPWTARGSDPDVRVDGTAPGLPASVADGVGADASLVGSMTQVSANWPAASDAHSGLQRYEYCIATSSTCASGVVATWTSTALATSVTRTGLVLANATTYYVCVRTVDAVGNVAPSPRCSNGQQTPALTVSQAAPAELVSGTASVPVVIDGTGFQTGATLTLGAGVTVTSATVTSLTRIDAVVTIASGATVGGRDAIVTNPNGSTVTATGTIGVRAPSITIALETLGHAGGASGGTTFRDEQVLDSPAGAWSLGNVAGTTATDRQGLLPGSWIGTVGRGAATTIDGTNDPAATFQPSTGHVEVPDHSTLRSTSVTLQAWARPAALGSDMTIASKEPPVGQSGTGYALRVLADGRLAFSIGRAGVAPLVRATSSSAAQVGRWVHVVGTWDGSTARLYVDGALAASATGAAAIDSTWPLTIGRVGGAPSEHFDGTIDEVAVYATALPAPRIAAHERAARAKPLALGVTPPGAARSVGPGDSGQATAGPAIDLDVTSDADWSLQLSATNWTSGTATMPVGALSWRTWGSAGAWTPMSLAPSTAGGTVAAGVASRAFELRVDVPPTQAPGTYTSTVALSVVTAP